MGLIMMMMVLTVWNIFSKLHLCKERLYHGYIIQIQIMDKSNRHSVKSLFLTV